MPRMEQHQRITLEETTFVTTCGNMPPACACDMADSLPDFALLALPDDELRRVEDHVEGCRTCQTELSLVLDMLATLATPSAPPPRAGARDAFLARTDETAPEYQFGRDANVVCGEASVDHGAQANLA